MSSSCELRVSTQAAENENDVTLVPDRIVFSFRTFLICLVSITANARGSNAAEQQRRGAQRVHGTIGGGVPDIHGTGRQNRHTQKARLGVGQARSRDKDWRQQAT
jgi:hypothetical protein